MFDVLSDIWDGIRSLPYLVADLLVGVFNAVIVAFGALATVILAIMPGFPEAPEPPTSGVLGLLNWVIPLGPVLAGFSTIVIAWTSFLAFKIALKWVKAL